LSTFLLVINLKPFPKLLYNAIAAIQVLQSTEFKISWPLVHISNSGGFADRLVLVSARQSWVSAIF
jgi:hypothetical protein